MSLEVDLDAGVPLCGFDSPSHDLAVLEEDGATRVRVALDRADEIPNRDFVLNYRVAGPRLEHALVHEPGRGSQPGTFLLITTPPLPRLAAHLPREVILVLDRSGSMEGAPLRQACQAAQQLLDRLDPEDAFNLIAFDTQVTPLAAVPLPAEEPSLRRACAFLEQLRAGGGTEMLEPLRLALQMPAAGGRERVRMVVFLTDGSVHGERELLAALRPVIGRSRLVAFGIGTAVNRHLLNKLTAAGRGFAEFLFPGENIARAVDRTLRRLGYAVLTDVELQWEEDAVEDVLPERCPDVYRNQPLVVLGHFRGEVPPRLTLRGRLAGRPYTTTLEGSVAGRHANGVPLAALWARQRIETLMDSIWERPDREEDLRRQVTGLARQYNLSSPYTSFLAVEYRSKAEREQARGAVAVEIPQYLPQVMPCPGRAASAATRPGSASIQHKLDRVRRPRTHITYQVHTFGAKVEKELPFVIGVMGEFSCHSGQTPEPLSQRRFLEIDRDNFEEMMRRFGVRLALRVPDVLAGGGAERLVELRFGAMADFEPDGVARQIEPLRRLLETRDRLRDLLNDVHLPEDPEAVLKNCLADLGMPLQLAAELAAVAASGSIPVIELAISRQVAAVLHRPEFRELEAHLARAALSSHEYRDQRDPESPGTRLHQGRVAAGPRGPRGLGPELRLQAGLRTRIPSAGGPALRPSRR